jgi:hypothetical protein
MRLSKKDNLIKKHSKQSQPYRLSITPTIMQSYNRGYVCLFYLKIMEGKIAKTEKAADRVYLDFDKQGRLLGVEII